jgi:hypothetical protein
LPINYEYRIRPFPNIGGNRKFTLHAALLLSFWRMGSIQMLE